MNLSFYTQIPYSGFGQKSRNATGSNNQRFSGFNTKNNFGNVFGNSAGSPLGNSIGSSIGSSVKSSGSDSYTMSQEMRTLLRELNRTPVQNENPYAAASQNSVNGFLELSGSPDSKEEKNLPKTYNYNYKEVANKIQQAKTSVSAGQAVLSAKRKVLEVRRKIAAGGGDAEDLQLALTHARRMEMVARKKKHHLELEELVVTTQKRDENLDKMEEASSDMQGAMMDVAEQELTEKEDAIFEERQDMLEDITEELQEQGSQLSDEMMSELNEMIAELGEEELKELEEAMEQLENLEVVDPHMSKEDLEELKRRHRNSENKAIVKANMDYLKGILKHMSEKGGSIPGIRGGTASASIGFAAPAGIATGVSVGVSLASFVPAPEAAAAPSIDIQV